MNWYPYFLGSVFLLWVFSSPRDKSALRIILVATIGSYLLTELVTRPITGTWKLVIPGAVELATIAAILRWSRNLTGYLQVGLLVVAWFAHLFCYVDLVLGSDLVYSNYELILEGVAIGQLAACHDTLSHNWCALRRWADSVWVRRGRIVHSTSWRARVLPDPRRPLL